MSQQQDTMECPRCGEKGLVRRSQNLYQCLSCNFRRDFSQGFFGKETLLTVVGLIILILLLLLVNKNPNPQDSSEGLNSTLKPKINSNK